MAKEQIFFTETPDDGELDMSQRADLARRIATYPKEALQAGLKIDNIVVKYDRFMKTVEAFDRIFQIAREVKMPHGAILLAPSGGGKSEVYNYFESSLPRSTLFAPGFGCVRVSVAGSSGGQLVQALLRRYGYPFSKGTEHQLLSRMDILLDLVQAKGTRLICFDNAHRLVYQADRNKGEVRYNAMTTSIICELMDEAHAGVVLAGHAILDQLRNQCTDLGSRFPVRLELKTFAADGEWKSLVAGFAKVCTWFDLSHIAQDANSKRLHTATNGSLRELKRLLTEAVLIAASAGVRRIDDAHLRLAFEAVHGFASGKTTPYGAEKPAVA